MSDRVSQYVLLCEDKMQEFLVQSYLGICEVSYRIIRSERRSGTQPNYGGVDRVLNQFETQLVASRQRQTRAETRLIVVADADKFLVEERRKQLQDRCDFDDGDPLTILIPKRHIETWICSANGRPVSEAEDCKPYLERGDVPRAARQIHEWARSEPPADSTCVASLRAALPGWRRIG